MATTVDWDTVDDVMLDMDGTVLDLAFDNYFWRDAVPGAYARRRSISLVQAQAELEPQFAALRGTLPWYSLSHWSGLTGVDLVALKQECRSRIAPVPGAEAFLRAARTGGRRLWLVTNADPAALDIKMLHTGIEKLFDRIVSSHEFGRPKEDPRFWEALQERHDYRPQRTLFVDDSEPVLRAATAAGIAQVVGIRWPDSERPPREVQGVPCIDRLADLLPMPPARSPTTA